MITLNLIRDYTQQQQYKIRSKVYYLVGLGLVGVLCMLFVLIYFYSRIRIRVVERRITSSIERVEALVPDVRAFQQHEEQYNQRVVQAREVETHGGINFCFADKILALGKSVVPGVFLTSISCNPGRFDQQGNYTYTILLEGMARIPKSERALDPVGMFVSNLDEDHLLKSAGIKARLLSSHRVDVEGKGVVKFRVECDFGQRIVHDTEPTEE